eukprot:270299-Amorphochlora_amoeboformis.AAC.1
MVGFSSSSSLPPGGFPLGGRRSVGGARVPRDAGFFFWGLEQENGRGRRMKNCKIEAEKNEES